MGFGLTGRRKSRTDRRTRWKQEQFKLGNCIECGRDRKGSPYKKVCVICAGKARYRSRKRQGGEIWEPGKPGRPPLIEVRKREQNRKRATRRAA